MKRFQSFLFVHGQKITAVLFALCLTIIVSGALAVHAAEPTDSAGVVTAVNSFANDWQMWILAALTIALGMRVIRGLFRTR